MRFNKKFLCFKADTPPVSDCSELYRLGITQEGFYAVDPTGDRDNDKLATVYCKDGWTTLLNRHHDPNNFALPWRSKHDYEYGVGLLGEREFFSGLRFFKKFTERAPYKMKVGLWSKDTGHYGEVQYDQVLLGTADRGFPLKVFGYSSEPSWRVLDSLYLANFSQFTFDTPDSPCSRLHSSSNW